jgi:hypothetical protein
MSDIHYHEVNRITTEAQPYFANYLMEQIAKFEKGEMSERAFLAQLTIIERKMKSAIDELFKIKFPKAKQRANLSVLRESFRQYLKSIEEVRKSVTKGVDRSKQFKKRLEKAAKCADKFAELMFAERYKSAKSS